MVGEAKVGAEPEAERKDISAMPDSHSLLVLALACIGLAAWLRYVPYHKQEPPVNYRIAVDGEEIALDLLSYGEALKAATITHEALLRVGAIKRVTIKEVRYGPQ